MSEENEELNIENEEVVNLNITSDQKIDVLADGTEILRDELVEDEIEEEEEISDENLRKLVAFTTGEKNMSDEDLEALRNDEVELERLIRISMAKASHLNYNPKKKFNAAYKKERQRKNKQAKRSRQLNRR
jgi:hypothetical protein